jgi:hypothetical protein
LTQNHTFAVYGLFGLAMPPRPGDGYGLLVSDGGPAGSTTSIDLFVRRELDGSLVVRFQEQDFLNDVIHTLELDALAAPLGADQIELRLQRGDLATDAITAGYRFWDDGAPISPFVAMAASANFFRNNDWARGGFFAVEMIPGGNVPEPGTLALLLPGALGLWWTRRRRPA